MPHTPRKSRLEVATQRRAMWEDRVSGMTVQAIANKYRCSLSWVTQSLSEAVENIDATRWLERHVDIAYDRLEGLYRMYAPRAKDDLDVANFVLKVIDRQSKLMGLDAPKRVDVYAIIDDFAQREGLDTSAVIDVVARMLPTGT